MGRRGKRVRSIMKDQECRRGNTANPARLSGSVLQDKISLRVCLSEREADSHISLSLSLSLSALSGTLCDPRRLSRLSAPLPSERSSSLARYSV